MVWCNDHENEGKRSEFVKQPNIKMEMTVCARNFYMQEKYRICKYVTKGFHRVLNSVIGKQKSLVLPSFRVNHSVDDFNQFFVDVGLHLHKSIADTTRKNIQES